MRKSIQLLAIAIGVLSLVGAAHAGGDWCTVFPTFDACLPANGGSGCNAGNQNIQSRCVCVYKAFKPVGAGKCKPFSGFCSSGCGLGTGLESGTSCTAADGTVRIVGSLLTSTGSYFDSIHIPPPFDKAGVNDAFDDFTIGVNDTGFLPEAVDHLTPADGVQSGPCALFPTIGVPDGKVPIE
ncbi:MAG TPA: hypothetical protein VFD84_02400 [Candidatus Binatia bacterium]|nr:hypothetical protein [Candidatus Binatia bacterium]